MERLIDEEQFKEFCGVPMATAIDIVTAFNMGEMVRLPCKVGDTVWTNNAIVGDRYKYADGPYPAEVVFIGLGERKGFFHGQYSNGRVFPFDFGQVGKTVFLTREEAEAARKEEPSF